jgi:hypothetical protein
MTSNSANTANAGNVDYYALMRHVTRKLMMLTQLVFYIVLANHPFSDIEKPAFRQLIKYCNPKAESIMPGSYLVGKYLLASNRKESRMVR